MLRPVAWLTRTTGFAVVGLLSLLGPPHGPLAVPVQITAYCLLGVGLLAWALIDARPAVAQRHPHALTAVLTTMAVAAGFASTAGGGGDSMVAFAAVAAMAAGSDTGLVSGVVVTAAGVLAIEIGAVVYGEGFGTALGYPLLLVVGLLFGRNRRADRIHAEQSAALLSQYERLQAEQRRADVLDERTRIAREIHDVLAHSLGALGIQIQMARAVLTDHQDIERAADILTTAQRMAGDGLAETRRAVHALRVDTLPLNEELAQAIDAYRRSYHAAVTYRTGGTPGPVPPDATLALLRTAQEALINAAKHAEGEPVAVRLDYREDEVLLTVVNELDHDPVAAPPTAGGVSGGYGLTGMNERLRLLNGTLTAGPRDGRWAVTARLPRAPRPRPQDAP